MVSDMLAERNLLYKEGVGKSESVYVFIGYRDKCYQTKIEPTKNYEVDEEVKAKVDY